MTTKMNIKNKLPTKLKNIKSINILNMFVELITISSRIKM